MEYYEEGAREEAFTEEFVPRSEYNDLMDKLESAQHDALELRKKADVLDRLIANFEELETHAEAALFSLRKSGDRLLRAIELIEEDSELKYIGEKK